MKHKLLSGNKIYPALLFILSNIFAIPAYAYIGPGAGVTSVGLALTFVFLLLLLFIGFIWYPIKMIFFGKKNNKTIGGESLKENKSLPKDLNDKESDKARDF